MTIKLLISFAMIASAALTAGCSNLADARNAKGTGVSREYAATFDKTWNAIPKVLDEVSLPLAGENREKGYFLAQRGLTPFSYGENVAIFVETVANSMKTRVEVVSKKAMATNIFAPNWSNDILEKLAEKLK